MLRKEFRDPRVHFAIVCASLGCPVLRGEAYVPVQLEAQLDDQVRICPGSAESPVRCEDRHALRIPHLQMV